MPVQLGDANDGMLVVKGRDLLRFFKSVKTTGQQLDAHSLQECFIRVGTS